MFVPVVDRQQQPLMPTTPARARKWVKSGKATPFWKGGVFCVRLNVEPSDRISQPIAVGIDPGSKKEGYSVVSAAHTYLNIQADTPQWVKEAVARRRQMRRTRRGRKTPCREPRVNRLRNKKHLPPSTRARWQGKLRLATWGLKKTSKKTAEVWIAHCVDAWVLAHTLVGGQGRPDNTRLLCITPLQWHRRQLHRFQPEQGGVRKSYGGTLSLGIKRGTLVKHHRYGLAYVGGTMQGRLSLHDPRTGKRLTQAAKATDCRVKKLLKWRAVFPPAA